MAAEKKPTLDESIFEARSRLAALMPKRQNLSRLGLANPTVWVALMEYRLQRQLSTTAIQMVMDGRDRSKEENVALVAAQAEEINALPKNKLRALLASSGFDVLPESPEEALADQPNSCSRWEGLVVEKYLRRSGFAGRVGLENTCRIYDAVYNLPKDRNLREMVEEIKQNFRHTKPELSFTNVVKESLRQLRASKAFEIKIDATLGPYERDLFEQSLVLKMVLHRLAGFPLKSDELQVMGLSAHTFKRLSLVLSSEGSQKTGFIKAVRKNIPPIAHTPSI